MVGMRRQITRLVELHPEIDVVNQPVLSTEPEEFAPGDSIGYIWNDIDFQPPFHEFPALLTGHFEILNDARFDGLQIISGEVSHPRQLVARKRGFPVQES